MAVQCVSYEDLAGDERLNPEATGIKLNSAPGEYAMVVVDEAQAFRNPSTQRASTLRRLLQGTPPKDLVLLTATRVNNSLWDLYYLLSLWLRNDAAPIDLTALTAVTEVPVAQPAP